MRRARRRHDAFAIRIAAGIGALVAAAVLPARAARANGAFPDSQSILAPAALPREISVVTNFGVVRSGDGGQTWLWSCEQMANALGYLYQYGAAPRNRLFAIANEKLVHSDDNACGWQVAGGMMTGLAATDFFPDPANADRVLAVAFNYDTSAYSVLQSGDGGATFGTVVYAGAPKEAVTGVESAAASPRTIYLTTTAAITNAPMLGRSTDGGLNWGWTDLSPTLGAGTPRIIAIDPHDAQKVLLLFKGTSMQSLALTRDGGKTVTLSLADGNYFTSYARTAGGTILIGGSNAAGDAALYRSHDGGMTFEPVTTQLPHIRGLAARGGTVHAATDNFGDGYALGVSTDEGTTWQPLMSYDQVAAIAGCLKASCQTVCAQEVVVGLWPAATCTADPPAASQDAGAGPADAGPGGVTDAGATGGHGGQKPPSSGGGGCAVAPGRATGWLAGLGTLAWFVTRRRRRREPATRSH